MEDLKGKDQMMNQLIINKGVFWTAPAQPGPLNTPALYLVNAEDFQQLDKNFQTSEEEAATWWSNYLQKTAALHNFQELDCKLTN